MPIPSTAPPHSNAELQSAILRSVSRSFYLSIRILPTPVRDPVALAYLLARATDTIADTAAIAIAVRMQHLGHLAQLIQGDGEPAGAGAIREAIAPLQTNASERALIEALPQCIAWLRAVEPADRADIERVLALINKGQALDVERFADPQEIVALPTAADLDEYTYLVAGCVGEFWTNICARKLPRFASKSNDEMLSSGVQYGKALQLINILRDIGADLRAGRCYLPADQLRSIGIAPATISDNPDAIAPLLTVWHDKAGRGLQAGVEYACAIRSWRVRLATALPALIGARTLALLRQAGGDAVNHRIKIPRSDVRGMLVASVASLASPAVLRRNFERYRK